MTTYLHAVSSLDGYIAGDDDDVGSLHDWYFSGDQVAIDIVPVVFGGGKRYFGSFTGAHQLLEDPDVVIQGDRVLHLRYPVRKPGKETS